MIRRPRVAVEGGVKRKSLLFWRRTHRDTAQPGSGLRGRERERGREKEVVEGSKIPISDSLAIKVYIEKLS